MKNMVVVFSILSCLLITACHEGPAEKQGKQIDKTAEELKDKITQPGPAEKAGRKIDSVMPSQ